MANALYDSGRDAFLLGAVAWVTDSVKAVLIDSAGYTVNLSTDNFLNDVPVIARIATASVLSKTSDGTGVADSADVTFTAVTGAQSEAIILYKDTGLESTSQLLAYIDTATGLPVTPSGSNIIIFWSSGANKIFKL